MNTLRDRRGLEPSLSVMVPHVKRRRLGWSAWVPRRWEWEVRLTGGVFLAGWAATRWGAMRAARREMSER